MKASILERRANANAGAAATWVGFAGLLASVPIAIRQRSADICVFPLATSFTLAMVVAFAGAPTRVAKTIGWFTQGFVAYHFLKKNQDDAEKRLTLKQ